MPARCSRFGCAFRQNQTGSSSSASKAEDCVIWRNITPITGLQLPGFRKSSKYFTIFLLPRRRSFQPRITRMSRIGEQSFARSRFGVRRGRRFLGRARSAEKLPQRRAQQSRRRRGYIRRLCRICFGNAPGGRLRAAHAATFVFIRPASEAGFVVR